MAETKVAIGIDPSLTGTAVCFYTPTQETQPHTERYTSKPATGLCGRMRRYCTLADRVLAVCLEADPEVILIEGYSYGSKGKAILDMAEFGGILRFRLLRTESLSDCQVVEVPPTTLKKWATGKGNANKIVVTAELVRRYGPSYGTDDEYDAFALARMAAQLVGWDEPATANQKAVIDKLAMTCG